MQTPNKVLLPITEVKQGPASKKLPAGIEKLQFPIAQHLTMFNPPGLDPHLGKEELCQLFQISKTLLHGKLNPASPLFDKNFPRPIYISARKPVWVLSELIAWQETLKADRDGIPIEKNTEVGNVEEASR